jgi:hypothetical protein
VVDKYVNATGQQPTSEEMDPLLDAIVMGAAMADNYQTYYAHPLPPHLKFCKPEQEILIPIPGTEHYLKARLDALAQDRRDNLYVVERKTYSNRPDLNLLQVSDQFIGYIWCAQQLDVGPVIGLAYDGCGSVPHHHSDQRNSP